MARNRRFLSSTRLGLCRNALVDFQYLRTLGYAPYGGAAVGEVLYAAARAGARPSRDGVVEAWTVQGRRLASMAEAADAAGARRTARERWLRAYNYLRQAEFFFDRHKAAEHRALYDESVAAFNRAIARVDFPAEQVEFSGPNGLAMPGYVFRPAADDRPRPTVVVMGGGDGHGEEMYFLAGAPTAVEHGYNVVLFHAPGQRGVLHRDPAQVFRPDSEVPIGAVVEDVAARPWADPNRTALYGLSFGGYHVLRAAARLDGIAAVVASAPLPDLFETLLDTATDRLPRMLQSSVHKRLDRLSPQAWSRLAGPARRVNWAIDTMIDGYMMWTSGAATAGEAITGLRRFRLGALESEITAPVLSLWAEGEGQPLLRRIRSFQQTAPGAQSLAELVAADGTDGHCGIGNVVHTAGIVYDWLDAVFAREPSSGMDSPAAPAPAAP